MTLFLNHWLLDSHLEGTTVNRRISLVSELLNKIYSVQRSSRQVQAWSCGGCLLFTARSARTHPDGHLGSRLWEAADGSIIIWDFIGIQPSGLNVPLPYSVLYIHPQVSIESQWCAKQTKTTLNKIKLPELLWRHWSPRDGKLILAIPADT